MERGKGCGDLKENGPQREWTLLGGVIHLRPIMLQLSCTELRIPGGLVNFCASENERNNIKNVGSLGSGDHTSSQTQVTS
ncbi:hypothetical protein STEG23_000959, partial [Scotinomys teguina]